MKCPSCKDENLVMSERQGIEIDYCPNCRGVWLDRGELDKIVERTATALETSERPAPSHREQIPESYGKRTGYDEDRYYRKKKKKGGLLGELFDF